MSDLNERAAGMLEAAASDLEAAGVPDMAQRCEAVAAELRAARGGQATCTTDGHHQCACGTTWDGEPARGGAAPVACICKEGFYHPDCPKHGPPPCPSHLCAGEKGHPGTCPIYPQVHAAPAAQQAAGPDVGWGERRPVGLDAGLAMHLKAAQQAEREAIIAAVDRWMQEDMSTPGTWAEMKDRIRRGDFAGGRT